MSTLLEKRMEQQEMELQQLKERYAPQFELLEGSLLAKVKKGHLDTHDYIALGKSLEQYDRFKEVYEAEGSVALMGSIPQVAYDVITVSMGTSVLPILASVQPIQEERGSVYFMNIRANNTKGNYTAGNTILTPFDNPTLPNGYASNFVSATFNTTGGNLGPYTGTLAQLPVRPNLITITTATSPVIALTDDGNGVLMGVGGYGTINYTTGDYSITLLADPGVHAVTFNYQVNLELQTTLAGVDMQLTSTPVVARAYALRGSVGMLQDYVMKTRFNMQAKEMLSSVLVQQINAEIGADIVRKLRANVPTASALTWDYNAPANVPDYQHRLTFAFKLNEVEAVMTKAAGRGVITAMVAGTGACSVIASQAGFEKLTDGGSIGPVIFGKWNGVIVVRVPDTSIIPSAEIIFIYKGTNNPFEAPIVYAPFMPLTVTDLIPNINAITQQRAAAVWAGVESVFPKFTAKLTISNLPLAL